MITTRRARHDEYEKITAFYRENGYGVPIKETDLLAVAETDGALCGILRLCEENDVLVLRGMRVSLNVQRQGVGTLLLRYVESLIGKRECFCIPHRHLESFYGQIGFVEMAESSVPPFLAMRCATYRKEHGLDVILMVRPARQGDGKKEHNPGRG